VGADHCGSRGSGVRDDASEKTDVSIQPRPVRPPRRLASTTTGPLRAPVVACGGADALIRAGTAASATGQLFFPLESHVTVLRRHRHPVWANSTPEAHVRDGAAPPAPVRSNTPTRSAATLRPADTSFPPAVQLKDDQGIAWRRSCIGAGGPRPHQQVMEDQLKDSMDPRDALRQALFWGGSGASSTRGRNKQDPEDQEAN
jgi:hypothetical protein